MSTILSLLLSKFGAIAAAGSALLVMWFYGKYQKRRADQAMERAAGLETEVKINQDREIIQDQTNQDVEELHEKIDNGDACGIADALNRLRDN